jgi:phosphotransferase system IIB component
VVRPGGATVQVVIGPTADLVAGEMRDIVRNGVTASPPSDTAPATLLHTAPDSLSDALTVALGGFGNITAVTIVGGRWRVTLRRPGAIDTAALTSAAARGWVEAAPGVVHILQLSDGGGGLF